MGMQRKALRTNLANKKTYKLQSLLNISAFRLMPMVQTNAIFSPQYNANGSD